MFKSIYFSVQINTLIDWVTDWFIDFNGISTHLEFFYP